MRDISSVVMPHEPRIYFTNGRNNTHSCEASYKAIISEWFEEVVTIVCLINLIEIIVPP